MIKSKLILAGVCAAILITLLTGCQTNAQTGAAVGAGVGCGIAMFLEKNPNSRASACAVGGSAMAAVGYLVGRQKDLELARTAAAQIRASQPAGTIAVQMKTKNTVVQPENRAAMNNASTVESLDTMIVSVPQPQIQRMDAKATSTLSMVGKYVSEAQSNSTVVVSAMSQTDYNFIVNSMQKGYGKALPPQKVSYTFKQLARGTQATVEVSPVNA